MQAPLARTCAFAVAPRCRAKGRVFEELLLPFRALAFKKGACGLRPFGLVSRRGTKGYSSPFLPALPELRRIQDRWSRTPENQGRGGGEEVLHIEARLGARTFL